MIMNASRERVPIRWAGLAVLILALAVVVSPFALDSFQGDEPDWQRRSVIGQTYGAISALVAALALCAIAVSVFFQWQEIRANREFARRAVHNELLKMAIDDPELRECYRIDGQDDAPSRQHLYCNLIFSFWEATYALGMLRHQEIGGLVAEMLKSQPGREFWMKARKYRLAHVDSSQERRFRQTFDAEYLRWSRKASEDTDQPPHSPGAI
jgi:hypothetical protein